jgi:hypothetical protein
MTQGSRLEEIEDWLRRAAANEDPDETGARSWISALSEGELETISACLLDIRDNSGNVHQKLSHLMSEMPSTDVLDAVLAGIEVQLALAVRNWRELAQLLERHEEEPERMSLFDQLSTPEI